MTIKELITELNKYPSDMQVNIGSFCESGYGGCSGEILASHIENDILTFETDEDGDEGMFIHLNRCSGISNITFYFNTSGWKINNGKVVKEYR